MHIIVPSSCPWDAPIPIYKHNMKQMDCLARSNMQFGSSTTWANSTGGWNGGLLSPNDEVFGKFNKVVLLYCDGDVENEKHIASILYCIAAMLMLGLIPL